MKCKTWGVKTFYKVTYFLRHGNILQTHMCTLVNPICVLLEWTIINQQIQEINYFPYHSPTCSIYDACKVSVACAEWRSLWRKLLITDYVNYNKGYIFLSWIAGWWQNHTSDYVLIYSKLLKYLQVLDCASSKIISHYCLPDGPFTSFDSAVTRQFWFMKVPLYNIQLSTWLHKTGTIFNF
jgi:hypothetical protein